MSVQFFYRPKSKAGSSILLSVLLFPPTWPTCVRLKKKHNFRDDTAVARSYTYFDFQRSFINLFGKGVYV